MSVHLPRPRPGAISSAGFRVSRLPGMTGETENQRGPCLLEWHVVYSRPLFRLRACCVGHLVFWRFNGGLQICTKKVGIHFLSGIEGARTITSIEYSAQTHHSPTV